VTERNAQNLHSSHPSTFISLTYTNHSFQPANLGKALEADRQMPGKHHDFVQ